MPFKELLVALETDPKLRAELMYFPDQVAERFDMTRADVDAVATGKLSSLQISPEDEQWLRRRFNYHGT
jgi:hypothetical protein